MIYTVTLNPALDYIVSMNGFKIGMTNRTTAEQLFSGGKGINVSILLRNLGLESTALGFVAGFTGQKIIKDVDQMGIEAKFIEISEGFTRINVKLKDYDGTEINGMGPQIDQASVDKFFTQLETMQAGDIVFLSGSIPKCLPDTIYKDIMCKMAGKGIEFVVDATKDLLLNVLEYKPFLIKPNNHELGEILGVTIDSHEDAIKYARKLQEQGAKNVLVSMAGKGAVLVDQDGGQHKSPAPEGKVINAVGAGDSMIAGFMAGWLDSQDYNHAFKMGLASGSASAFTDGFATKEQIEAVYNRLS